MIAQIKFGGGDALVDFSMPIDISCILSNKQPNPLAFFVDAPKFEPLMVGRFVGSVAAGGACNCEVLTLTPHCQGTHTECIGHITLERHAIHDALKTFVFEASLITVLPQKKLAGEPHQAQDLVITKEMLEAQMTDFKGNALVVRTLPNTENKRAQCYSGNNPPYFTAEATGYLAQMGVAHLLTDLPSVDKEDDGGLLAAHHAYWCYPHNPRKNATITELIFVPNSVADGRYLLNLQIASLDTDASPSKPVLYAIKPNK